MNDQERILNKIAAALRLAEKASTEAEAEVALQTAQRLASTYSIDLALARAHQGKQERRATPTHRTITLGKRGKKGLHTYVELFTTIARVNDVTCNIAHNSTYVIAFGFPEDIELTEALYASLVVQMVTASDAYLRSGAHREEKVYREVRRRDPLWGGSYTDWELRPVSGHTARIDFHLAFARRVGQRLSAARDQAREQAIEQDRAVMAGVDTDNPVTQVKTGTELALIAKSVEIADYYKANSNARGTYRGGSGRSSHSAHARAAGDRAGGSARLGGERSIGGSSRALTG